MSQSAFTYGPAAITDDEVYTLSRYVQDMSSDIVFKANPLLKHLMKNKRDDEEGGNEFLVPLEISETESVGAYADSDTLNVAEQEIGTIARFGRFSYYGAITLSRNQMIRNKGPNKREDYLMRRTKNSLKALKKDLWQDLWATSKAEAIDVDPLPLMAASGGTVGGIDSSVFTVWDTNDVASGPFTTQGIDDMRTQVYNMSDSTEDMPDAHFTTQEIYEAYEAEGTGLIIFDRGGVRTGESVRDRMDLGFQGLDFQGAPIKFDKQCVTESFYSINSEHIFMCTDPNDDFVLLPPVRARDGFVETMLYSWTGDLCADNRFEGIARLTALTTS